ncbi:hypothetical protein NP233_g6762 [Leucocoprinus birnbaumii]|uniref:Uncharacterized protein n=1 Tax=Leucocoprinus birnbaumii TaxID=56174 RepID=A0AAD5VQJ1_9AGAR|nr:hypothetical protein NP233_g6762 [Leucocoprinus birnbaumii]
MGSCFSHPGSEKSTVTSPSRTSLEISVLLLGPVGSSIPQFARILIGEEYCDPYQETPLRGLGRTQIQSYSIDYLGVKVELIIPTLFDDSESGTTENDVMDRVEEWLSNQALKDSVVARQDPDLSQPGTVDSVQHVEKVYQTLVVVIVFGLASMLAVDNPFLLQKIGSVILEFGRHAFRDGRGSCGLTREIQHKHGVGETHWMHPVYAGSPRATTGSYLLA